MSRSARVAARGIRSGTARACVSALLVLACASPRSRPPAAEPSAPRSAAVSGADSTAVFTKRLAFAVLEDYDKGEDLADVAKDFALMRELGVTTWRGSFGWDDYEPERGHYDFDWLHRFADLAERQGIELRPYLGYTPAWASGGGSDRDAWNDPPSNPDDWYRFVHALVSAMRRHRNVRSYEIYNEENVRQWWDGTRAQYSAVLARGAAAVRDANPAAQVLLGGMVWPDVDFLEAACVTYGNASAFDVIPFHAYPETWTPDTVTVENYLGGTFAASFVAPADSMCGRKPIWINETGFATVPGKTQTQQAEWWVRAIATFAAAPGVEEIGIYEIKDARADRPVIGDQPNYHLGLTSTGRVKKRAFGTVRMLVRLFGGGRLTVADAELSAEVTGGHEGRLYRHLFVRPDGAQVLVVWDRTGAPVVRLRAAKAGSRAVEYDLDGVARPYPAFDGRTLRDVRLDSARVRVFEIEP